MTARYEVFSASPIKGRPTVTTNLAGVLTGCGETQIRNTIRISQFAWRLISPAFTTRRPLIPWIAVNQGDMHHKRNRKRMRYLHTMVRVSNLEASLDFYCNQLGLEELNRFEVEAGRFTLVFLAAPGNEVAQLELTYNWDPESYSGGRNFGHLAYEVENIYEVCQRMMDAGIPIHRPPRDGHMAFVRSPDQISIELIQKGQGLQPEEPWASMGNTGEW